MQKTLAILVDNIFDAQVFIDYFPRSYRSNDGTQMLVIVPCNDPLAYGKEACRLTSKNTVRAYGINEAGKRYSLLKEEAERLGLPAVV
jgi:hypothetical protein